MVFLKILKKVVNNHNIVLLRDIIKEVNKEIFEMTEVAEIIIISIKEIISSINTEIKERINH